MLPTTYVKPGQAMHALSTASLDVAGSGQVTIRATKEVNANVSGVGDVTVLGKPATIHKHVSGVATIHD